MYSFEGRVRFSEIDESGRLSIPGLVNYLQDCSTFHSMAVGMWPEHAFETGRVWMISAWEIEIDALPRVGDEIRVSTWASGFKGLRANRNFTLCMADDVTSERPLVRADSSWFMFDTNAKRPIRIPDEEADPYRPDLEHDPVLPLPAIPRMIRVTGEGAPTSPVTVTGAHLDMNHHVNNAQYVSLALGALDEWHEATTGAATPQVRRLDVHYSRAAKLGDVVCPHVHETGEGLVVTLDDEASKPYALVRVR